MTRQDFQRELDSIPCPVCHSTTRAIIGEIIRQPSGIANWKVERVSSVVRCVQCRKESKFHILCRDNGRVLSSYDSSQTPWFEVA